MKKYRNLIILAVLLVVVISGSVFAYNKLADKVENETSSPQTQQAQSNTAQNFTVYDGDDNEIELSGNIGKPIVVNFWATWCPPCKQELPHFNTLYQEMGNEVTFMMVDLTDGNRETVDGVKDFVQENGYTFPVYYDSDTSAAYAYNVSSIPMTLFIDENGYLVDYHIGAMDEETLRDYIDKIK